MNGQEAFVGIQEKPSCICEEKTALNSVVSLIKHGLKLHEREMKLTKFKSANKYSFPSRRVKRSAASSASSTLNPCKQQKKEELAICA